jgi:hypothetical protein
MVENYILHDSNFLVLGTKSSQFFYQKYQLLKHFRNKIFQNAASAVFNIKIACASWQIDLSIVHFF